MADFYFRSFGTVVSVSAESEEAKVFARENFPVEGWQGTPERFYADWRPARDLAERLVAEGWEVVEP